MQKVEECCDVVIRNVPGPNFHSTKCIDILIIWVLLRPVNFSTENTVTYNCLNTLPLNTYKFDLRKGKMPAVLGVGVLRWMLWLGAGL